MSSFRGKKEEKWIENKDFVRIGEKVKENGARGNSLVCLWN